MGFIKVENISIIGLATSVPKQTSINSNEKFIAATGVAEKRVTNKTVCASDLCLESAKMLLSDLSIDRNDIEILIFVS
jgi:3-oxoacyl-[acyl-carrier-protein] synthase-3